MPSSPFESYSCHFDRKIKLFPNDKIKWSIIRCTGERSEQNVTLLSRPDLPIHVTRKVLHLASLRLMPKNNPEDPNLAYLRSGLQGAIYSDRTHAYKIPVDIMEPSGFSPNSFGLSAALHYGINRISKKERSIIDPSTGLLITIEAVSMHALIIPDTICVNPVMAMKKHLGKAPSSEILATNYDTLYGTLDKALELSGISPKDAYFDDDPSNWIYDLESRTITRIDSMSSDEQGLEEYLKNLDKPTI